MCGMSGRTLRPFTFAIDVGSHYSEGYIFFYHLVSSLGIGTVPSICNDNKIIILLSSSTLNCLNKVQ